MIVQMDKMSAPSRELAQRLYEKNIELDSRRRKSAQARVPSDPSIWQQMRENYESIILEDHAFSEKHNIEHALWQLHYKKIEELRAHYGAAQASAQSGKGPPRPDRITKIRLQFKTFLSEATGFYHDLIMKIRAKYGLPLGYFSDDSENRIVMEKDIKKSSEMKKGLISCHRCLIYLGDLARYKGLYGEANSRTREYAAASSYYLQSASIWPSIGNPHHQLAILASYTGDEFLTVYRYFRSLAVENPCSTARDNLIVAFEKNRQSYTQQIGDVKASVVRFADKGRGQKDKPATKDSQKEAGALKENASSPHDVYRSFCTRFVRLNGILFTKTSLETFAEVLSHVNNGLRELLSSGPDEELHFGANASENGLFFIRLVAILIFTVHSARRENEGQSYAEIVQRAVLLQNAYSAAFDTLAHLLERCEQLRDPATSYLLPGVLVFLEWLACSPDVAAGSDADEKQIKCRSNFWTRFISLINKLLASGSIAIEDNEDETCFFNMSRYEEGENENRLALSEDFELRGFLPLVPAHTILDFSAKRAFGNDGSKERSYRAKRVLAAGKALFALVRIDQKKVNYDPKARKFIPGFELPQIADDISPTVDQVVSKVKEMRVNDEPEKALKSVVHLQNSPLHMEGEDDDDEEIVFRPPVAEKQRDFEASTFQPYNVLEPNKSAHMMYGSSIARPLDNVMQMNNNISNGSLPSSAPIQNITPQHMQQMQVPSRWLMEEGSSLANSLKDLGVMENGHGLRPEVQNLSNFHPSSATILDSIPQPPVAVSSSSMIYSQTKSPEPSVFPQSRTMPLVTSAAGVVTDGMIVRTSASALHPQGGPRRSPVSRPIRHAGPPPGFGPVPKQQVVNGHASSATGLTAENPLMDDYSWLDGYQMHPALKNLGLSSINSVTFPSPYHASSPQLSGGLAPGAVGFPFPGKQMGSAHSSQMDRERGQQDYQALDYLRRQHEEQQMMLHQSQSNMVNNGNFQGPPQAEQQQYQGSLGTGRYFV